MGSAHTPGHGHGHEHDEPHRPVSFYIAIAVFLTVITAGELGPLFGFYRLPPLALVVLSAVKFFTVVAFFMHLWDDASIFTRLFAAPLFGAVAMVTVLMLLHHTFAPSPKTDNFAVQERYNENWNQPCSSWLRSSKSNRWYCSSPALDDKRVAMYAPKAAAAAKASVDLTAMSDADRKAWMMKTGEQIYSSNCAACHQANGEGIAGAFPPLAGSDFIQDPKKHAQVVIKGLSGAITVKGAAFNGAMPAQGANYSDEEIAAVMTYERNSWGNNLGDVSVADVKAAR